MISRPLSTLGGVFEGVFPATVATCTRDGDVNLIFVSQVHLVDEEHVAFSEQFLRRTLQNLLESPRAQVCVVDPVSGAQYRLDVLYVRRETEGPLVARMTARLEGIAVASGKSDMFRLRAALVCRVLGVREVLVEREPPELPRAPARRLDAGALGALAATLDAAPSRDETCRALLDRLALSLGYDRALLLLAREGDDRLVTFGARGFAEQDVVGTEVAIGYGIIGRCASTRQAMGTSAMSRDRTYARSIDPASVDTISLPALRGAESLLAVPLAVKERLVGVLVVESRERMGFGEHDEAVLKLVGHIAASAIVLSRPSPMADTDNALRVRYYERDDSVFVDDVYLVKGAAGRVLLAILRNYTERRRAEIANRELRLDPSVALPVGRDNLEARLHVLRRRLAERSPDLRLISAGRGRLRVECDRAIVLETIGR